MRLSLGGGWDNNYFSSVAERRVVPRTRIEINSFNSASVALWLSSRWKGPKNGTGHVYIMQIPRLRGLFLE